MTEDRNPDTSGQAVPRPDVVCEVFLSRPQLIIGDWPYRWQLEPMTRRQRQVIKLVALGNSSKEIAALLKVTARTVEFHRQRAMVKCGVRNRIGLALYAVIEGLISPEEQAQFIQERIAWIEQRDRLVSEEEPPPREFLTPGVVAEHKRVSKQIYTCDEQNRRELLAEEKATDRASALRLPGGTVPIDFQNQGPQWSRPKRRKYIKRPAEEARP